MQFVKKFSNYSKLVVLRVVLSKVWIPLLLLKYSCNPQPINYTQRTKWRVTIFQLWWYTSCPSKLIPYYLLCNIIFGQTNQVHSCKMKPIFKPNNIMNNNKWHKIVIFGENNKWQHYESECSTNTQGNFEWRNWNK